MTRILLVRHGTTDWNEVRRVQGQADIEMNAQGRAQAEEVAERLSGLDIEAVYSSDLRRAVETARAIAARHQVEVRLEPAFREIDQGEWTGLLIDEIQRRWPDGWGPARHHSARPGGEAPDQVRARALDGLKRIVQAHPAGSVVVVTHGGTIRGISAEALGYDAGRSGAVRGVATGDIVSVEAELRDGTLVLTDLRRMDGRSTQLDDPNS